MTIPNGLAEGPIYLDYNATTPIDSAVTDAMLPYLTGGFGNPSSEHHFGTAPRAAMGRARGQVAVLLGAQDGQIVFTGSGSEADNLAIRGAALAAGLDRPHVITQQTEHPAVLEACRALQRWHGAEVSYLPVNGDGVVDPSELAAAVTEHTVLVSIMAANNETGALQPVADLVRITHEHGAVFHCDAAQAAGKIQLDVAALDVDLLTVVGHKMYAPKGIAALYVRPGVPLEPLVYGVDRNTACAPAPRMSPSPSPWALPPNSSLTISPRAATTASRPCGTVSTTSSPPAWATESCSTGPRRRAYRTRLTSASTE